MILQPRDERIDPAEEACQEYGIDIPLLPHDVTEEWIADFIWNHNENYLIPDDKTPRDEVEIIVDTDAALIYQHVTEIRAQHKRERR